MNKATKDIYKEIIKYKRGPTNMATKIPAEELVYTAILKYIKTLDHKPVNYTLIENTCIYLSQYDKQRIMQAVNYYCEIPTSRVYQVGLKYVYNSMAVSKKSP